MTLRKCIILLPILIILGLVISCSTRYHVKVSSIHHPTNTAKKRVILLPLDQDITPNDLQFQEFAGCVKKALTKHGYMVVDSFDDAETAIFLYYGIGEPQRQTVSIKIPKYGQTGIKLSTTTGTISSIGDTSYIHGKTTYEPEYGITGTETVNLNYVTYFRYIIITAYDIKHFIETEELLQLWSTEITSTGRSDDLREVFPVMIAASLPYIGKDTGKQIDIKLTENDDRVLEIKEK